MKIGRTEFLIGADPEVFIRSKTTGLFVSAHGMLPGTKENPHVVKYGAVQVDGMAAEFNIDPCKTEDEFVRNTTEVMAQLKALLPDDDEYELVAVPTCHFGKEMIDAQPDVAKELGCDPDFNAWTGEQNPVPNVDMPFRTGAGHIHIGWGKDIDVGSPDHKEVCEYLIRNLDYATRPSMLYDKDTERRKLYGDIGAYRPKSYGCEYRTPSNDWVGSREKMRAMYRFIECGLNIASAGRERNGSHWSPIKGKGSDYLPELKRVYGQNPTATDKRSMMVDYKDYTGERYEGV